MGGAVCVGEKGWMQQGWEGARESTHAHWRLLPCVISQWAHMLPAALAPTCSRWAHILPLARGLHQLSRNGLPTHLPPGWAAPMRLQAGYYCSVCDCILRDSQSYLDHLNGKWHNRALGMSMRVEKSTAEQVGHCGAAWLLGLAGLAGGCLRTEQMGVEWWVHAGSAVS